MSSDQIQAQIDVLTARKILWDRQHDLQSINYSAQLAKLQEAHAAAVAKEAQQS